LELLRDKAGETDGKFVCGGRERGRGNRFAKMWMWTVGYSVGDMVYIAQTTADQKQATRFSKVHFDLFFFIIGIVNCEKSLLFINNINNK
jgi:hypothetical protein